MMKKILLAALFTIVLFSPLLYQNDGKILMFYKKYIPYISKAFTKSNNQIDNTVDSQNTEHIAKYNSENEQYDSEIVKTTQSNKTEDSANDIEKLVENEINQLESAAQKIDQNSEYQPVDNKTSFKPKTLLPNDYQNSQREKIQIIKCVGQQLKLYNSILEILIKINLSKDLIYDVKRLNFYLKKIKNHQEIAQNMKILELYSVLYTDKLNTKPIKIFPLDCGCMLSKILSHVVKIEKVSDSNKKLSEAKRVIIDNLQDIYKYLSSKSTINKMIKYS